MESDIALTQTDAPDPVLAGGNLTYSLVVSHNGGATDTILVRDMLPPGVTFVSAIPSQGTCSENLGIVNCDLGPMSSGGAATVTIVVRTNSAGVILNTASANPSTQRDPDTGDNSATEETTVRDPAVGDLVWDDLDGDGIQDAGEPGMANVVVVVYSASTGAVAGIDVTDPNGKYLITPLTYGEDYYVRFTPPEGYVLTLQDQGGDDQTDSDADPLTWKTPIFSPVNDYDFDRWDAGMIPDCVVPDETVYIYGMTLTDDGNDYPVLHFMDPNQPSQVTGYNVYRSSDAGLPPGDWPLVASDVVDMSESEPDNQWVDSSGDVSPTGAWYYQVTAYNHRCPAEGPR